MGKLSPLPMAPVSRLLPLLSGLLLAAIPLVPVAPLGAPSVSALELRGSTVFVKAPWRVDLITYYSTVWEPNPEYYFTLSLDPAAGADLGQLTVEQIRGADTSFQFSPERSRAFLGRPRRAGRPVPVQAQWDSRARRMTIDFPEPVPPGSTVTVVLRPWANPGVSDTYLFQVVAWPAGPRPVASPVGVATLRIYSFMPW